VRKLLPVALAFVLTSCEATPPEDQNVAFFRSVLETFPHAGPGEFPTPDSVVRAYFQAILDNDVGRTFACLPLRQRYETSGFDEQVRRTGVYDPASNPFPGNGYTRFLKVLGSHHRTVHSLRLLLLAKANPEVEALFEKQSYIDAKRKDGKIDPAWLGEMRERLDLDQLRRWRIKEVAAGTPEEAEALHGIPVSATARVSITLAHGETELPPIRNIVVAKIDGNYQIMLFPFPAWVQ